MQLRLRVAAALFGVMAASTGHARVIMDAGWECGAWNSCLSPSPGASYQFTGSDVIETWANTANYGIDAVKTPWARAGNFVFRSFAQPPAYRSEIAFIAAPYKFNQGDERYYGMSVRIDSTWLKRAGRWATIITQWKLVGPGPMVEVRISEDGSHALSWNVSDLATTGNGASHFNLGTMPINQWVDLVTYVKWSQGDDGHATAWMNGKMVADYSGRTKDTQNDGYMKCGMYTEVSSARNIYFDNVRIATTFAEANPSGQPLPLKPDQRMAATAPRMKRAGGKILLSRASDEPKNLLPATFFDFQGRTAGPGAGKSSF